MFLEKIKDNLKEILINKPKIILGLSGGPDSVFLLIFLKKLEEENIIELACAHLDHGWRQESTKDVKFCQNLCKKLKIKLIAEHAKDLCLNLKFNGSKEEMGRYLRRTFFENLLKELNFNYIALAHQLDDQQETFFYRIIRGTTLTGLTGIKNLDKPYIRPILNVTKQEILDYLNQNNIKYLIDYTNLSDNFLRNRIRKYVIPAINKCDSRFNQKFSSTLKLLQEEEIFLKNLTQEIFNKIFTLKNNAFTGNLKDFLNLDLVLQKRLLIYWLIKENLNFNLSEKYLKEILRFLKQKSGGIHQISINWAINKKQNLFWINKSN